MSMVIFGRYITNKTEHLFCYHPGAQATTVSLHTAILNRRLASVVVNQCVSSVLRQEVSPDLGPSVGMEWVCIN